MNYVCSKHSPYTLTEGSALLTTKTYIYTVYQVDRNAVGLKLMIAHLISQGFCSSRTLMKFYVISKNAQIANTMILSMKEISM